MRSVRTEFRDAAATLTVLQERKTSARFGVTPERAVCLCGTKRNNYVGRGHGASDALPELILFVMVPQPTLVGRIEKYPGTNRRPEKEDEHKAAKRPGIEQTRRFASRRRTWQRATRDRDRERRCRPGAGDLIEDLEALQGVINFDQICGSYASYSSTIQNLQVAHYQQDVQLPRVHQCRITNLAVEGCESHEPKGIVAIRKSPAQTRQR